MNPEVDTFYADLYFKHNSKKSCVHCKVNQKEKEFRIDKGQKFVMKEYKRANCEYHNVKNSIDENVKWSYVD